MYHSNRARRQYSSCLGKNGKTPSSVATNARPASNRCHEHLKYHGPFAARTCPKTRVTITNERASKRTRYLFGVSSNQYVISLLLNHL